VLAEEAAARLKAEGLDVRYLAIDPDDHTTITAIATQFGHLDSLVNNAGIIAPHDGPAKGQIERFRSG
jgi:NAD(P)-dependent dehydrogenase (short-subunit alcohol dehydrogenase family)